MLKKSSGFFSTTEPLKPSNFVFDSFFPASGVFTSPTGGWYKVYIFGKCGDGSLNNAGGTNLGGKGGTGGGSGGVAISVVWIVAGAPNPITITPEYTQMFDSVDHRYMRASAGVDGERPTPGIGGTAQGGNIINLVGGAGGDGGLGISGTGTSNPGIRGDNNGSLGGQAATGQGPGGGGGGGARWPGAEYCSYIQTDMNLFPAGNGQINGNNGDPPTELPDITIMRLYGAGSGAGGSGSNTYGSVPGGKGQGGCVIIEKGVD